MANGLEILVGKGAQERAFSGDGEFFLTE